MHQLFCEGVWLHAAALHAIPCGLCAVQDPPATRQDQMLQVHLVVVGEEESNLRRAKVTRIGHGLTDRQTDVR